jgi:hypothetical protein
MAWTRQPPTAPPDTRAADIEGLSHVWTAALISIIGTALGVAVPLGLEGAGYVTVQLPVSGGTATFDQAALLAVTGIAVAGIVLSILSFWFYRSGFLALRTIDSRFSSSPTWALMVIIGLAMVMFGLVIVIIGLLSTLSCSGTSTMIPLSCVNLGALLGGLALLLIGVIVLLIGYIGTLVAIWRLGTRYNEALFKVGAVLLILPFLSVVGQILILVGASGVRRRIREAPAFGMAPSVQYQPPPR